MATIDKTEDLVQASIPDFRVCQLPEHIDRLAECPTFRLLGNSEELQGHVAYFCKNTEMFKEKLEKGLDSDLPSTISHNDLWSNNIYMREKGENYMFFDFVDTEVFLQEWSCRSEADMDVLRKWFNVGQAVHTLVRIVIELRDRNNAELAEADRFFDRARLHLRTFNFRLRQDVSVNLSEFRRLVTSRLIWSGHVV